MKKVALALSSGGPRGFAYIGAIEELLRRGYDVAIGKIDNAEIDFIASNAEEKLYIQVTESMNNEDVRRRELAPLQKVRDNYEKMILSLDPGLETSFDGIKSKNLIDWLLTD